MNKGIDKETAAEVCRNIHNAGIWNHIHVFLGFPTETRAEAQETIDFLISNKDIIHSFNINSFVLDKKAPMINCPEQYSISNIDKTPEADFDLAYDYTVSSGLTPGEALELSIASREMVAKEYKGKKFFKLDGEDLLLYLSHFEKSDPHLVSVPKSKITKSKPEKRLTPKSVPRIKRNVVLDKLRFDIKDIIHNIANNNHVAVYPSVMYTVTDAASGKVFPVSLQAAEVFELCDGEKSVRQIASELSDKYDEKRLLVEEECIDFLNYLSTQGYVLF
jgi:hypothetical protein